MEELKVEKEKEEFKKFANKNQWEDFTNEQLDSKLVDLVDTRNHLNKTKWTAGMNFSQEDFEQNTSIALGIVSAQEEGILKEKKRREEEGEK